MSVPLLIGNFKSEADYRRKVADQKKLLQLQSKLNTEADKASLQQAQIMEGVVPGVVPDIDISQTLLDYNQQRQDAIVNADEVMTKRDAMTFVDTYLQTLDDLVSFNRNFGSFQESISGIKLIDPAYMNQLWQKFQAQLFAGTSDLASLTTIQGEVDQIARDILSMVEGEPDYAAIEAQVKEAARKFDVATLKRLRRKAMAVPEREAQQARAAARISERALPRPPRRPTIAQQRRETEARQRLTREAREARALEQLRQVEAEMGQRRAQQKQRATESRLRRKAMLQRESMLERERQAQRAEEAITRIRTSRASVAEKTFKEELPQEPTIEPNVRRRAAPRPRPRR